MTAHIGTAGQQGAAFWTIVLRFGTPVQRLSPASDGENAMSDEDLSARVTLLEETIAHQSRMIEDLSGEIAGQWKIIDQLQFRLERLTEQFRALEDAALEAPGIAKPPHY
jgi:SlyX protein